MKVLHVEMGRHLYGGAQQVAYLLDGLAGHDGEHLLACAQGAAIATALRNPAVTIRPLPFGGDADLGFVRRLRHLIRAERPALLHIHSRRGDALSLLAGKLERLPMVYSRRVDNPPHWLELKLKFPCCTRIITISQGIREVLVGAGVPAAKITCVPSAVDSERYRPPGDPAWLRQTFGVPEEASVWAIIAQLIPRKGHALLFEALPAVLARHPQLHLLVLGKGALEAELRRQAQTLKLSENVHFAGFREDLHRLLPGLDGVVHPAWLEGLGVSLLEAAACGVPIVACRTGGIPEIVQDGINGWLVQPGDAQALARALLDLLDHPHTRAAFGQAGRERVLNEFAIPRMVAGNARVYRDVLATASSQPLQ